MNRLIRAFRLKPGTLTKVFSRNVYMSDPNKLELEHRSEPFCPLSGTIPKWSKAEEAFEGLKDGQVNPNVPDTGGDANIHSSHFDYLVYGNQPLHETEEYEPTFEELRVGKTISEHLVEDGSTIEAGLGSIPQSIYQQLSDHRELGIHTEMFSNGLVDLISLGVITNAHKRIRPGKIVTSFVIGTRKVFDFVDKNPLVGVGGVVDFMRGAAISPDGKGKPIIGMTSRTSAGEPKIVPVLKPGTGVILTRAHVHYVVTEYGVAYLFGRNLRQRAYSLIQIAHPDDREALERAAYENLRTMPSPD
ncbi:unnamed protein product [Echinostoma caproni]|uniref:AcetylCoA_hyd_C domain-containing protein n=1 Tax=Echinostoma caproni TaxID=27848 RepID=A0A183AIM8_9TREM|nr:unnamed protein product [Echinostoma caproni]